MAQVVALTNDARQTFRTVLGGQSVRVTAWWQPLDEYWYMSLSRMNGAPIISAVRLVESGRPLSGQLLEFSGQLIVDGRGDPGREAWTSGHRLIYVNE